MVAIGAIYFVSWLVKNTVQPPRDPTVPRPPIDPFPLPRIPRARPTETLPRPRETVRPPPEMREDERMRKFLEALGVPKSSLPPVARPSSTPPPAPQRPVPRASRPLPRPTPAPPQLPRPIPRRVPVEETYEPEPIRRPVPEPPSMLPQVEPPPAPVAIEPPPEIRAPIYVPTGIERHRPQLGALRASLRNRSEFQRAILLREILGPPLGLQTRPTTPTVR
jgi:hypothetical protein